MDLSKTGISDASDGVLANFFNSLLKRSSSTAVPSGMLQPGSKLYWSFFFFWNFKRNWNVQIESACQALPHQAMRSLPFPAPRTRWTWPSVDREKCPLSRIGWLSLPLPGSIQCHQCPFRPMRITPHQTDLDYLQSPLFLAVSFLVLLPPKSLRSDHICLSLF